MKAKNVYFLNIIINTIKFVFKFEFECDCVSSVIVLILYANVRKNLYANVPKR